MTDTRYLGAMTMGVNDSLVEVTAAIAGLTIALQNARLVALAALITGLAGSLSMAASEYLEKRLKKSSIKTLKVLQAHPYEPASCISGSRWPLLFPFYCCRAT